jgi:hypothetical protein
MPPKFVERREARREARLAANGVQTRGWEARGEAEDPRPFAYQLPDGDIDILCKKWMGCEWSLRGWLLSSP